MFTDNKDFYPTPKVLAYKMFDKIPSKELIKIKYILEPSAGKGDLINYYKQYFIKNESYLFSRWDTKEDNLKKTEKYIKFEAIEIDENLRSILRGNNINLVYDDFINYNPSCRYYDLILANFPFSNGCEHLIKAIHIQERIGGKIVCLINAETIKNPYSNNRKILIQLLDKYNANIEYLQEEFINAERKTNVEIALIYIDIPMQDKTTIFERNFEKDDLGKFDYSFKSLVPKMNKLEKLVFEYNIHRDATIELFKENKKLNLLFNKMGIENRVGICSLENSNHELIDINDFINKLNYEYWSNRFINETNLRKRLPSTLRESFNKNIREQENIAFTLDNLKYFYEKLLAEIPTSYNKTVAKVFNKLTVESEYSETAWCKNIHYFTGWKTNKAYKICGKSIIYHYHNDGYYYRLDDTLSDLLIIFENIAGETDEYMRSKEFADRIKNCEKKIETKFFIFDSYKKNTLHITYKSKQYLDMFNIMACKGKMWLKSDFCEKSYSDMTEEEKQQVKDFGFDVSEYENLRLTNNSYSNILMLGDGK